MPFCPNLSNPTVQKEFNSLVAKYGENKAYYLWDKYEGNIPKKKQTVGQNKKAVTQWFKSRFPNVDVFIKNTLENVGDAEALGYVEGAAVYLNEAAGVDTKYHEAFHLFFRTSLSDKQREQLYKDAEKSFGKPTPQDLKNAARGQENASKEDIYKLALEEKMAEATHEYGLTQEAPKNLSQRILKFIKDLWAFIKAVLGKPLTVRQAMRLIESNKIPSKFVRSAEAFAPGKAYLLKEFAQSVEQYENIVRVASAMVVDEYDAELKKLDLFEDAKTYNKQKAIMEKTIGKRLLGDPLDRKFSRSKIAEKILELSISYKGSRQEVSKEDFKEYRDLFEAVNQADESQIEEATLKLKQYMAEKEIQPIPPAFTAKGELISKQFHIDPTDLSIDEQKIEAKRLYSLGQHFRAVYKYWYDQTRNGKVVRGFRYDLIQTLKESGIKYVEKEKESTEFIDEVGEVERIYSVGRMEEDPGKKLSLRQRILLSRIPYESSEYSYTGLKSYVPATEVYKVLLNSVVNSENLDEMISKLRAEGKTKPHLSKIADFVNSLTAQEQAEFTRAMKMSANEFLSAKVVYTNTGESIQIFSPNLGSILKSKREEWRKASTSGVGLFRPRTSGIADVAGGFEINLEKQAKIYQLAIDAKIDPKTGLLQGLMNLDNQAAFAKLLMELGFKIAPTEEEAISRVRQVLSGSIPDLKDVKIGTFINDTTKLHKIISLVIGLSRQNQAPVLNDNFFSTEQSTVNNIIKTFVAPFETADASTFINNLSKSIYAINTRSRLSDAEIEIRTLNSETKQSKALDVLRNTLQHDQGKYKSLLFKLLSSRKYTKDFQFADFDSFTTLDGVIEVENFSKADILSIKLAAWNNRGNKEEGRIALDVHGDRQKFPTIPFPKLFKSDVLYDLGMQNESLEKILSDELMLDLNRMKKAQDDIIAFRSGDVGIDTLIEKYHYTVNDDGSLNFKKGNWRKFNSLNKEVEVDSNGLIADETLSRLVDGVAYAIKNQGDLLPSYSESFKSLLDESLGQMKANATEMVEFAKSLEIQYDDDFVGKNKEAYLTEWANYDYLGRMFARSLTRDGVNYTKNGKEFIKRAHHSSTPGMKGAIKGELSADRNYGMKPTHTVSSIQDVLVSLPEESRRLFKERLREKFNAPVLEELSLPDRYKTSLVAEGTLYLPDDVITVSISSIQDGLYEINGSSYYVSKEVVDGDITFKAKRYIDAADKIANQSYVDMESTDAQSFITLAWQKNIEEGDGRLGLKEQTAYEVYELTREWDPEIKIKAYKPYTDVRKNKNGLLVNYSFKTSYITLTPNLVKGIPILEDLLDRMEGKGVYEGMTPIDVVHTTSAQKLAIVPSKRVKTNTNEAQFFDLVTEEIDSSALRFPEDVPSKTNKRDTNLGRQTRINMLANINPNGLYTYNAGLDFAETVSGQELKNIYHRATATRVRRAMQQIYEELGYDKVLAATTLDEREAALKGMVPKMREVLKELMSERDANVNENILDALEIGPDGETAVALGDPILQSRFDQLIASIFKNRVHKHKMKGMHAVQFADLGGIEIDESLQENLRFLEINGNRLAHAEVDISANYLMALGVSREQIKIAQDTGDMTHINEELRRIMGYRIPNQGKSSLIILKIRRILPDEFDGVIRVPPGITVMMGSDFDIDKMFVLFPEVETVDGEVRKVKVPYSELVNDLDKINTLSDKQISNIMFDTFEAVSSNLYHLDEVISPLDGPDLVDAQQKSRFYKPDTNIFSSSEAVTAFYENMLSHKLRGGWAIANAGRNILIGATLDPKLLESDLEIVVTDELNGEKVSMTNNRLTERTMFPDVINVPRPTDYAINLHIGAAVDSVKNPLQDSINDNEKTLNFRAYLYNRGLNVAQTTAILNHPFVRAMSDKAKADNVSLRSKMKFHKHEKLDVFLNLEGLNQKPANLDIGRINAASVDADQTLKRIAGILNKLKKSDTVKDFTKIELDTLKFLRDISFLVDESSRWYNLIKAANVFTIDKAGTIPQNLARMDMLDMYMIKDRDSDIYGGKALLSQILINPTVYESANAAYQALQDSLDVMTAGGFLVNQPALKRFRYFLSENSNNVAFNEVSQQQILSAVSHQIYTKPGSPFYEKGFLDKANIEQMHFQNENNIHSLLSQVETILSKNNISSPLVEALKPETKTFNGKALKFLDFNNTIKRTTSVENMIISSWEMLYFADEVFTEEADIEVLKKFAKALITNQILFSGFMPSRNAMWHLFPVRIQEELGTRNHFRNELKNLNNTRYLEETFGLDFFVNLNSFQTFTGQFLTKKEADSLHPALKSLPNKQTLVFSKSDSSRLYNVGSFIELIVFNPDGSSNSRLYQVEKEKSGEDTVLTFTALKTKGDFKFFELNIRDNDNNPLQESLLGSAGAEIGMITNGPVVPQNMPYHPIPTQEDIPNGYDYVHEGNDFIPYQVSDISSFNQDEFNERFNIPEQPDVSQEGEQKINTIPMQPDNVVKILSGEKTTTLRTNNLPSGVYIIGGKEFNITNRGLLSVEEAGGIEAITKSEAFAESGPKYSSTKEFLAGRRKLYVYDIKPTNTSEVNISSNLAPSIVPSRAQIKLGVPELFEANSELASIGTVEQYSSYLATIFPNSKVNQILYHGSTAKFEKFDKSKRGSSTGDGTFSDAENTPIDSLNAFFFSTSDEVAIQYGLLPRIQHLESLEYALSTNLISNAPKTKALIRQVSPKLADHLNEKAKVLSAEQLKDYMRDMLFTVRDVNKELGGTKFLNQFSNINRLGKQLKYLKSQKDNILAGNYVHESFEEGNDMYIMFYNDFMYSVSIDAKGDILKGEFDKRNITSLSSQEFDRLMAAGDTAYTTYIAKVQQKMIRANLAPNVYRVILDVQKPLVKDFEGLTFVNQFDKEGAKYEASKLTNKAAKSNGEYDSVVFKNIRDPYLADNYGVLEPSQIHILGTKEDIENFRKFVGNTKTSMSKLALGNKEDLTKARKKAQRLKNSFAAAGVKVNVVFGKLPDGVKGQVQGNVVTIDPSQMSDDTMYHEHAHILVDMLPESEVKGYIKQMYSLRPDIVAMVKKNYPELANDEFALGKEVLVTAIGLEGANIERKNPSKLRILINRIMRAIGKLFGITPDAAVVLAEKLFVGDIQKLSLSKEFNPQIQLQRTLENKINDLFVDARSNLDIQIRNLKMKPETQQTNFDILKLKQLQGTLEKIKDNKRSVDGFFAFAEYVHNKTALLKAKMNDVKRLTKNGVNSKDAIQLLNTVEDIRNTIDTFYHTDKANSLIDKMRLMIREMMEENQFDDDTLAKEVLYNLVEATNTLGLMEQEYPEIVAPIVVDAIYSKGVSSINKKLDEVIDSVRKTQSTSGMNNNPQYQLLKKNKEQIMEEAKRNGLDPESEWKRRVVELKIETLQNKKLNRENLVAELTRAFKDKSGFSLYLDPIIYSSEANLQLFAKTLEESNFKAHKDQIALLRKSQPYYERFKAFKGSDTDKNAFYKDLFEVIEVPKNKDTIKVLALVQKYNVTAWDASRKKALESYLVDRPQYGTPAYDLWDLKKGNDYRREKAKWWGENSVPIANASQIYNGWLQDLATLKAQRDATSPNNVTEIGIYNQMIEDIQYKINSSFMPKYGVFTGQLAMPKDKDEFINPKYKTIEQTPQLKEMYTFLLNVYKEKQRPYGSSSPQHRNAWENFSYVLPSIRQTNIESLQRKGALGLAKEVWQDGLQTVETDQDLYGAALDVEGNEYKHLPRMYTASVDEKHITRDLLSSILMFSYRSDQYKYKSELTGLVNAMINLHSQREMIQLDENGASLLSREAAKIKQKFSDLSGIDITAKTSADKSNTLNHLMQYIDVAFYGINKKKIKSKILGVDPNKFAAAINSLSAVGSLAFNTLQIGNQAIMDNLSQFQEAIAGQYFTAKNQAWGVKTFFASGAGIADIGSFAPKTKLGKVVMHFDALVGAMDSLSRDASGNKFLKAIQSGNLLAGQAAVEFQTSAVRMLALMDAMKGEFVDSKGEVITNTSGEPANLYDLMIETDEGVVLDPRVDTEKSGFDEADFRMKLRGLSKRTNQVKGNNDASTLSRTPLGSFLMLYKNYFIPGWRKRFGYGDTYHTDHETGEVIRGYYESTLDYFKLVAQNSGKFGAVYQMMSEVDKQNLRRAMVEASTILTTMIVFSALSAILDDDEEPPYAVAYFAYQARRLQTEMTSYINPFEAIRMFKAPMAAANFMGKWADLVNHIITVETPYTIATTFGIEPSEQLTKKAIYERDSYWGNEGDRKTIGKIGKVLPIIYGWSTVDAEVVEDKIRFFGG